MSLACALQRKAETVSMARLLELRQQARGTTSRVLLAGLGVALSFGQVGIAHADAQIGVISDPFEGFNRKIFSFNKGLDRAILRPVAMTYRRVLPNPARDGVRNLTANLNEPNTFLNSALQLRADSAARSALRFGVNSTVGIAGIFDVASTLGVYRQGADFGQTLARYGVKSGPYLVAPGVGPTSARDLVGFGVDLFLNPLDYARFKNDVAVKVAVVVAGGLDTRVRIDKDLKDFQVSTSDSYAAARSIWAQNRAARLAGDKPIDAQSLPDFTSDPAPSDPATGKSLPTPSQPHP